MIKNPKTKEELLKELGNLKLEYRSLKTQYEKDITERKQVENDLHESKNKYRDMVEQINHVIFSTDNNGILTFISPVVEILSGYKSEEMIGHFMGEFLDPSFLPQIKEQFQKIMTGIMEGMEYRVKIKSGGYRWVRSSSRPILKDNKPIGMRGVITDITDHKLEEESLRESEIKLKVILESTADGILAVDGTGKVIKTNKRFAQLWHIPQSLIDSGDDNALLGFILDQLVNPEDFISKVKKLYNSTDEDLDMLLFRDGRVFERYSAPLIMTDARLGRVWSFRDITLQKQVEVALHENERKFKELFDKAPVGYHELDSQGRVARINHTELDMFGYTEEEMIGQYVWEFVGDEEKSHQRVLEKLKGLLPPSIGTEIVYRRKDLTTFPASVEDLILRDANDNIIGIRTTVQDISKRKKTEEEISMLAQTLRNINECVSVTDLENKFIFVNQSFLRTYGYSENELIGKHIEIVLSQNNPSSLSEQIFSHTTSGGWSGEVLNKRKDGSEFPVYLSTKIIYDKDGNALGRVGIASDITERKRTEQEIKKKNEELSILNAEKDKFFSIIAHDLRSPFGGFMALTEMMSKDISKFSSDELSEIANTMNLSAQNLFNLLQNLLEWAQFKKGSLNFTPRALSLSTIVSKCIEQINQRAIQKGIAIINEVPLNQEVFADKIMIESILGNFLSNSVKFTKRDGTVKVKANKNVDQMIEIAVSDTGVGIPKNMMEKLFKINEQTGRKGTDGELSTGLGLLLCKEFVEKNNGRIWADTGEGKGSTFYFTLPSNGR